MEVGALPFSTQLIIAVMGSWRSGPMPPEQCAMPDFMRDNYTHLTPELAAALDPILLKHRDLVYERHVALPLDF